MKKLFISSLLVFALVLTALIGCAPTGTGFNAEDAAAVFTLDVNPGVRIFVDADNKVITVEATNDDGEVVVGELDLEGVDYGDAVEEIIDVMEEKGYIKGDESAILISIEKELEDISEKVNDRINKAFEKHGKVASVIEQELDGLDKKVKDTIKRIAEEYDISEGKAHVIEKIREEHPELSVAELAELRMNELGMMLEGASEDIKKHFDKIGKAVEEAYLGREAALKTALEGIEELDINIEDIKYPRVKVSREDGKMVYEVEFVYGEMEYEFEIDAKTGEILEWESEPFEEFDAEGAIKDFMDKNGIDPDKIVGDILDGIFGEGNAPELPEMSRGELLRTVLEKLGITEDNLKKTEVEIHRTADATVAEIEIKTNDGNEYELVVEVTTATVLKIELNGEEITTEPAQ